MTDDLAVVRDATPDDARAIAEVHVASWRWAYRGDLPQEFLEGLSIEDREQMWVSWFADPEAEGLVLVAADARGVVGFGHGGPSRDDDTHDGVGEVKAIYLLPDATRSGTGTALLETITMRLRAEGFGRLTLWVLASNDRARGFYEHRGWSWDGTTSSHRFDCGERPMVRYRLDP